MGNMISIHQQSGAFEAYTSFPDKLPRFKGAVIVAHELWGLTEQIKGVADRIAAQGYYVVAPDLFSTGGVNRRPSEELQRRLFSSDEKVRYAAMPELRAMIAPTQTPQFTLLALSRMASCFEYTYNQPLVHQRVAAIGFGLGGQYTLEMAIREPRLRCAIDFYGHAPRIVAELRHIKCPILAFYGEKEQALIKEATVLASAMKRAGVDFKEVIYQGAGHAFFNEANYYSYNQTAADDSWRRAQAFIRENMAV
jgi:carboxymethylenebutenolidase